MLVQSRSISDMSSSSSSSSPSQDARAMAAVGTLTQQLDAVTKRLEKVEEKLADQQFLLSAKNNALNVSIYSLC